MNEKELTIENENEMQNRNFMLTTTDNPYNPYTNWDEWFAFDEAKGYCSSGYLARIAVTSQDMSDEWNEAEIQRAINEIVRIDPFKIYTRVYEDGHKDPIPA